MLLQFLQRPDKGDAGELVRALHNFCILDPTAYEFGNARDLSPLNAQKSSGSRLHIFGFTLSWKKSMQHFQLLQIISFRSGNNEHVLKTYYYYY